jgi:DnaK suppressor protein
MAAKKKKVSDGVSGGIKPYKPKKGEDYMSAGQKEYFALILQAQKDELSAGIDNTVTHLKEGEPLSDLNDRASREEEFGLELRTRGREQRLMGKIDDSLKSLEEDEYGFCIECGVDIGFKRLEARPTATLCIDCKTVAELKEKQAGK